MPRSGHCPRCDAGEARVRVRVRWRWQLRDHCNKVLVWLGGCSAL